MCLRFLYLHRRKIFQEPLIFQNNHSNKTNFGLPYRMTMSYIVLGQLQATTHNLTNFFTKSHTLQSKNSQNQADMRTLKLCPCHATKSLTRTHLAYLQYYNFSIVISLVDVQLLVKCKGLCAVTFSINIPVFLKQIKIQTYRV